jgi:hypothetical protein
MPIKPSDNPRLKRICLHEAGHLVVAKELNFTTHGLTIRIFYNDGHAGDAGVEPRTAGITQIDHLIKYLQRRIKVLYAGVYAESISEDGSFDHRHVRNELENGAATNDHSKIREHLQTLRNVTHPETTEERQANYEIAESKGELMHEASRIVKNRYTVINAIAEALVQKVTNYSIEYQLTEGEISQIPEVEEFLRAITHD